MEQVRKITCFASGNYVCDKDGNIYNKDGLKLKQSTMVNGYKSITLSYVGSKKTFLVHRLIAFAWIDDSQKPDINHKNCIKSDNRSCNLEWVTKSENSIHAYVNERICRKGVNAGRSKLTAKTVLLIKYALKCKALSQVALASKYKVSKQAVNHIATGKNWHHLHLL